MLHMSYVRLLAGLSITVPPLVLFWTGWGSSTVVWFVIASVAWASAAGTLSDKVIDLRRKVADLEYLVDMLEKRK